MEVNGNTKKMPLTESPFIHKFEFSGDKGYWTGNHMILQVEDCIDCLRILFTNQYDFAFLFDHSSGHAKKRVGGLSVSAMNKGFGGEKLQSTLIEKSKVTLVLSTALRTQKWFKLVRNSNLFILPRET